MKLVTLFLISLNLFAAETFIPDNRNSQVKYQDNLGKIWSTSMMFTSDGSGVVAPFFQQSLIGNANNYYPTKQRTFVVGRRTAVANVTVDLWEGPTTRYVFPATAQQMRIVSSSANDTLAGTGVQKIHVDYLDANYDAKTEIVSLNGTTPVLTTATNILRINGLHSIQNGTIAGVSAGNISATNTAGTITYGYILAGLNTARQAVFTIPNGKTGYLNHWQSGSGAAVAGHFTQIEIRATSHDNVLYPNTFLYQDGVLLQDNASNISFPIPIPFPAKSDVVMSATADSAGANVTVTGTMVGWIE